MVFTILSVSLYGSIGASAAPRHGLAFTFGSANSRPIDPEPLDAPSDVAVNEATGDVYVTDTGDNRVEQFTAEGEFVAKFNGVAAPSGALASPDGIAIDNDASSPSYGDVYVLDSGHDVVDKFSPTGEYLGELTETEGQAEGIAGVAVDPSGRVWVYAKNAQAVEFDAEGAYVAGSSFNTARTVGRGLAVDAQDDLYIITEYGLVRRAVPPAASSDAEVITETNTGTGVAVDEGNGNAYIDQGDEIFEYPPFGEPFAPQTPIEEFGANLVAAAGITVDATDATVYVADPANNQVQAYALGEAPSEAPHTGSPTSVAASTATFHGELNPGGASGSLEYQFDYDTGASCGGAQAAPSPPGNVTEAQNALVETTVTHLKPSSEYTYCLAALDAFGTLTSAEEVTFTTTGAPPAITSETATEITSSKASLAASINPENKEATYHFEYSTSETLSDATSVGSSMIAPSDENQPAGPIEVDGLDARTIYYYRTVASNGDANGNGTEYGPIESFLTAPAPPTASTGEATGVTATTAIVSGLLNGMGADTHYFFNYGLTESYGSSVPENAPLQATDAGSISVDTAEAEELVGLTPNTTYHYQLVVFNAQSCGGSEQQPISCQPPEDIAYAQDREFTTLPLAPGVTTDPAASVTSAAAQLTGRVVPQGATTSYRFEYGTSTSYGQDAPATGAFVGPASEAEEVTASLEDLQPNTTYRFRLIATNAGGTTPGADESFTTNPASEPSAIVPAGYALTGTSPPGKSAATYPSIDALVPIAPTPAAPATPVSTRSQALAKALKACAKDKKTKRRRVCEKQARKRSAKTKKGDAR